MALSRSGYPPQLCRVTLHVRQARCFQGTFASAQPVLVRAYTLQQSQSTRSLPPSAPLHWNQPLFFSQLCIDAKDAAVLHLQLQGEPVLIELLQLSSRQTGSQCLAKCETTVGNLLNALQRPHRLSNGSLSISVGDIELIGTTVGGQQMRFLFQYALDVIINEHNDAASIRPLIDAPHTRRTDGTTAAPAAGQPTHLGRPLDVFEGPSELPATARPSRGEREEGGRPVEQTVADGPPHCHECCSRRQSKPSPRPYAQVASAAMATAARASAGAAATSSNPTLVGIPSMSPFAASRTLTHCALPRTATGLAMAQPLHPTCRTRCGPPETADRPAFAVRHADGDLLCRRDFCSSGGRSARNRSCVEFTDHPSHRPRHHRHSSPPACAVPGELERSPRKPTKPAQSVRTHSKPPPIALHHQFGKSKNPSSDPLSSSRAGVSDKKSPIRHKSLQSRSHDTSPGGHQQSGVGQTPQKHAKQATSQPSPAWEPPARRGHVSFAGDPLVEDTASSSSSGSSVVIGPITVTASPPDSPGLSPPPSPPLSVRDLGVGAALPLQSQASPRTPASPRPPRQHRPPEAEDCGAVLRRMRNCGDEVRKLSMELQTRIDSLLSVCCPHAQDQGSPADGAAADLEDLRASLHSARKVRLQEHQTPRIDEPVRITDTDYWSQKLSQYTGRSHRQLFDETLEKAYLDLYKRAQSIH